MTLSSPITINSNINEIDFNGATLTVGSLAKTGISVITGHSHCIIKNLIVSGTWSVNTDTVNNIIDTFSGVENVFVGVTINGTHYGRGFHNCQRLTSCKSEIKGVNITEGRAYNHCEYLYMCRVGANSKGTGFFHCTSMDSCDIFNGGCTGSELIECSKYTKVSYYVSGNRRYFSDVDNISTKTLQINGINIANIAELSNVIANSSESVNSVPIIDPNDKSIQKMGVVIGNADNGGTGYSDNPTVVVRNTSGNIFINDGHYNGIGCTTKYAAYLVEQNKTDISGKQDKLISGTNIKTINNQTLLGSGNITISGGGSGDVTAAGDNTFTGNNVFNGIAIADILDGTQYQITGDNGVLMFTSGATNEDIQLSGVATPTFSNSAANKKYVDDKVAAAGGGSAPVLVDIDDISGSVGDSVPVDVFNKIANAASAKTPIFGYSKLVEGSKTTYEIIPLYVKNVSSSLSIQFVAANAYNSVGIMKRSDTEYSILISSSRPFALDTSVDKSSTRGIQSSAVWKEIHSEPMTVNTATSGVTTLSSTDKHKILCYADSGTQQYNLPSSPVDGETFLFLKVRNSHTIIIQSGTGNQNIYNCSNGSSVVSVTIGTSTKRKITVTYSSTVGKWFLMADDFLN